MSVVESFFSSAPLLFVSGFLLRVFLLFYGVYQDAHSALKYTDIDYYVFTDAARSVAFGRSPYERDTYRYTPLLSWVLIPTSWSGKNGLWFHSGKALFAISDLLAGWLILALLQRQGMNKSRALKYASIWLLNPMVATISTRGSSEGLLCVLVVSTLWAFETRQIPLAGVLLGLSVHFKIYPFVYGVSMVWALESNSTSSVSLVERLKSFVTYDRVLLVSSSLVVFCVLNMVMYIFYGYPFLEHTFFYHLTRIDHRHNFSPYNTLLHLSSAQKESAASFSFERLAFLPQMLLSMIILPLTLSRTKNHLPTTLLAQTLAFVTFNKVCTSQYFLWYLIFLPFYLPYSSLMERPRLGITALGLWVAGQGLWLQQGFQLEFLGKSAFVPGLWVAGILFFAINCWLLGVIVQDVVHAASGSASVDFKEKNNYDST